MGGVDGWEENEGGRLNGSAIHSAAAAAAAATATAFSSAQASNYECKGAWHPFSSLFPFSPRTGRALQRKQRPACARAPPAARSPSAPVRPRGGPPARRTPCTAGGRGSRRRLVAVMPSQGRQQRRPLLWSRQATLSSPEPRLPPCPKLRPSPAAAQAPRCPAASPRSCTGQGRRRGGSRAVFVAGERAGARDHRAAGLQSAASTAPLRQVEPARVLLHALRQRRRIQQRPVEGVGGDARQRPLQLPRGLGVSPLEDSGPGEGKTVLPPLLLHPQQLVGHKLQAGGGARLCAGRDEEEQAGQAAVGRRRRQAAAAGGEQAEAARGARAASAVSTAQLARAVRSAPAAGAWPGAP